MTDGSTGFIYRQHRCCLPARGSTTTANSGKSGWTPWSTTWLIRRIQTDEGHESHEPTIPRVGGDASDHARVQGRPRTRIPSIRPPRDDAGVVLPDGLLLRHHHG